MAIASRSGRYSVFAIAREAMRQHQGWSRAWESPAPRDRYQVVIVGAGGHGLATAYYLGKNFGITDVAVIGKGLAGWRQYRSEYDDHPLELSARSVCGDL